MKYTEAGKYELRYVATDECGNATEDTRDVTVWGEAFNEQEVILVNSLQEVGQPRDMIYGGQTAKMTITNGKVTVNGNEITLPSPFEVIATVSQSQMFPDTKVTNYDFPVSGENVRVQFIFYYSTNNVVGGTQGTTTKLTGDIRIQNS